jgi:peptidoglycan/LPS O-acetylase OafA/YrhL
MLSRLQATPNWMTTVLLAILLTLLTYKLVVRSLITWRKENNKIAAAREGITEPLLQGNGDGQTHQEILNRAFQPEAGGAL